MILYNLRVFVSYYTRIGYRIYDMYILYTVRITKVRLKKRIFTHILYILEIIKRSP